MKLIYKKSIISLGLLFIFIFSTYAQKISAYKDIIINPYPNTNFDTYIIHSLRIANIIKQKAEYMAENELDGITFNDEQKEILKEVKISFPKKITVLTYEDITFNKDDDTLQGPMGVDPSIKNFPIKLSKLQEIENETIKNEIIKDHKFYIQSMYSRLVPYNTIGYDYLVINTCLDIYELFTDEYISEYPGICILEYKDSYPIMVTFIKGENNAVLLSGTVYFKKDPCEEDISRHLLDLCYMKLHSKCIKNIPLDSSDLELYEKAYDIIGIDYEPVIIKATQTDNNNSKLPVDYDFGVKINPLTGEGYLCNYISYPYYSIKEFGSGFDGKIIKINKNRDSNKEKDTSITIQKGNVQVTYSGWINFPDNLKEGDSITKGTLLGTLFGGGDSGMKLKIQVKYKDQYLNPAYLRYLKVIK